MKALEGIKVVELATFIAVPTVGKFFADQGAEVIKIEAKSGDPYRFAAAAEWRSPPARAPGRDTPVRTART